MGILRRLLGSSEGGRPADEGAWPADEGAWPADEGAWPADDDERARELQLARDFDAGLSDLQRDQLRFARYAWQPPDQHRGDADDRGRDARLLSE